MGQKNSYTDKQVLTKLETHLVKNMGSIYSMSKPTWNGVLKRMAKDEAFAEQVKDLQAKALWMWEKKGLDNLSNDNPDFNTGLYKHFTQNKKSFLSHQDQLLDLLKEAQLNHKKEILITHRVGSMEEYQQLLTQIEN